MQISTIRSKALALFRLNSQKFTWLMLFLFVSFALYSTHNGSQTLDYDQVGGSPELQNDPQEFDLPDFFEENLNLSDIDPPDGFDPPADVIDNLGGFVNLTDLTELPDTDPGGGNGGNGGGFSNPPDIPTDNPPVVTPPRTGLPTFTPPPSNVGNGTVNTGEALNQDNRPNKARNLHNISKIFEGIPALGNINIKFPETSSLNIIFATLVLGLIYVPQEIVNRMINPKSEEDDDNGGFFFKPDEKTLEKRAERERRRKLKFVKDYILSIIAEVEKMKHNNSPNEIITWTYFALDDAFSNFSDLRRQPSTTPLEHATVLFSGKEIDRSSLEKVVDLFYRTHFAQRE
ncbi:MAG: DUF4129 domain-containing protein, partial [Candidatus Kariarchaeaceae archaeon]